jgi:hypothetical protein
VTAPAGKVREGKAKTIRAWQVVCADGIPHGEIHRFKGEARAHLARAKDSSCNEWYGPHVVVELTGTFTPKASKRVTGRREGQK